MADRDSQLALQGEVSLFYYVQDDLNSEPTFMGLQSYDIIDSLTKSLGDLNPVTVPDPAKSNNFIIVRKVRSAPELGEVSITERFRRNQRSVLEQMRKNQCDYVIVARIGDCSRPDNYNEWDSLIPIIGSQLTSIEPGTMGNFESTDPIEQTGSLSFDDFERLFPVRVGEKADALVLAEVIDVIYADQQSCGTCTPFSSGCDAKYALTLANSGSPGLSSQLVYTTNGTDYTKIDIAALGGLSGSALNAVGNYLVVVSEAAGGHVYALKNALASNGWTLVTTGYQAGGSPRCIFALAPQIVYIGGAGGYVYKSSNITASVSVAHDASLTTENTNAVHGVGQYVLTGHNNNALLFSSNQGVSWSLITGPVVGEDVLTVYVRNQTQWYVGMDDGTLWYTVDGGTTWTQRALPSQSTVTVVWDIQFSPDFPEVGAVVLQRTATGEICRTTDGGRTWFNDSPGIVNLGTAPERYKSVALCGVDNIFAGGKKVDSTDGILVEAS